MALRGSQPASLLPSVRGLNDYHFSYAGISSLLMQESVVPKLAHLVGGLSSAVVGYGEVREYGAQHSRTARAGADDIRALVAVVHPIRLGPLGWTWKDHGCPLAY